MNIENFLTVLAWIWVVCWSLTCVLTMVVYCSMSKLERALAKINVSTNGNIAFVVAIAWLVTR